MSTMLLVPLEDLVVFPNMNVTLTVDVGTEEQVLLVPRHENDYASVGVVAEVTDRVRLPGGGRAVALNGLHRGVAGAADDRCAGNPARRGRGAARSGGVGRAHARARDRVPRRRRGDPRAARRRRPHLRVRPLDHRAGRARRHRRLLARPQLRAEGRAARDARRARAARAGDRASSGSASPRCRCAAASARTSRKALRSSSASTSSAARWSRSGRSSARTTRPSSTSTGASSRRPSCPRRSASRPSASSPGFERQGESSPEASMIRNYLDWLFAVPWGKRSEERLDPGHTREVLDTDHAGLEDVKDRIVEYIAVRKLREERGIEPDKRSGAILTLVGPPGHRQDLDRRVDRPCARTRVRPHVARRRPRRGRDPRSSTHVHRRAAGPARAGAARRRDDEPGDPAGRGRQGRRRLARRPVVRAARGARSGAEPLVPRPLPRRRARSLRGRLHRHRQHRRLDPRAAARPDGGDPVRRLHDRREGRDRPRLPVAAAARAERAPRGRGHLLGRRARDRHLRVHAGGRRTAARARAREAAAQDRDRGSRPGRSRRRSS